MDNLTIPNQKTGRRTIRVSAIEYLSGCENYTLIHIKGEKPALVAMTLSRLAEQLPGFVRIHKQTLINPYHVKSHYLRADSPSAVQLRSNLSLPVARRRITHVRKQLSCKPTSSIPV